ncbi:MAG: Calx-beta domain-containing protein [Chloroflexota bacterium]
MLAAAVRILVAISLVLAPVAIPPRTVSGQVTGGATLTVLRGAVAVSHANGAVASPAATGLSLGAGDRVATLARAAALITFFDGSELELESDTTIAIKQASGLGGRRVDITIENVLGNTVNRVASLADPSSSYRVESGGTVAVVRGTSFFHGVDAEGNVTVILVEGGPIYFPDESSPMTLGRGSRGFVRVRTNRGEIRDSDLNNRDPWNTLVEENGAVHGDGLSIQGDNTGSRTRSQQPKDPGSDDDKVSALAGPSLSVSGASVVEGDAGTVVATVTVTLSGQEPTSQPVTVAYTTADGAAIAGADYLPTSGSLTFPPGALPRSQPVSVSVLGDLTIEPDETFQVRLTGAQNAFINAAAATVTIVNDDVAGSIAFGSPTFTVSESAGAATVTLTRSLPPAGASVSRAAAPGGVSAQGVGSVSVTYSTSDGSATAPGDYTPVSGTITFAPNETTRTFTIPIVSDTLVEGAETINLTLSGPSLPAPVTAVLTIMDDDVAGAVQFSSTAYSVAESGGTVAVTVTRTGGTAGGVAVNLSTVSGTAISTNPADFAATATSVTFGAGETSKVVSIPIVNDSLAEGAESFSVVLSAPTGGAVLGAPATATVTIADDDVGGAVQFSAATYSVPEAAGALVVTVTRTGGLAGGVGATVTSTSGSAVSPSDFTAVSVPVSFAAGDTSQTVNVPIVNDPSVEGLENFTLTLSAPTGGGIIGSPSVTTVTIVDDDVPGPSSVQFSAGTFTAPENGGSATITVTRTGDTSGTVSVNYAASNGTASSPADYAPTSGSLTFGPGVTSQTFAVSIVDDLIVQGNLTVSLALSGPGGGATLGAPNAAVLTIVEDDLSGAGTLVVNSAADSNVRDTVLTLREAILVATGGLAYGSLTAGERGQVSGGGGGAAFADVITFAPSVTSVTLTGVLPPLSTGTDVVDGQGAVTLLGGAFDCLTITSNGNTVRGITVRQCAIGINVASGSGNTVGGTGGSATRVILGANTTAGVHFGGDANSLLGSLVGTNAAGSAADANAVGVRVMGAGNVIGGTSAAARNLISGNTTQGVLLQGGGATGNAVQGNYIGTAGTGVTALANGVGVATVGAPSNTIGGTTGTVPGGPCSGACNLISGNTGVGVSIGAGVGNVVQGNFIGVRADGTAALPNGTDGVDVVGASGLTIGGTTVAARNLISGNGRDGIIMRASATGTNVLGNYVGTNAAGAAALANQRHGVRLEDGAASAVIGGTTGVTPGGACTGACNVLSGNVAFGISMFGAGVSGHVIQGNHVGVSAAGTVGVGNGVPSCCFGGIDVGTGVSGITLGGVAAGAGNVVSGNVGAGVFINEATVVQGNKFGTGSAGTTKIPNTGDGIIVFGIGSSIGGSTPSAANILSGNGGNGVAISGGSGNTVAGNYIGTNQVNSGTIGNTSHGVALYFGATGNTIGGTTAAAGNVISANTGSGVDVDNSGAVTGGNTISANRIGTNAAGMAANGNTGHGVHVHTGVASNTIGGITDPSFPGACTGTCNVISGNAGNGILLEASTLVHGNRIGTGVDGTTSIPNASSGVEIMAGGSQIGTAAGNVIALNGIDGVQVNTSAAQANTIRKNSMFQNSGLGIARDSGAIPPANGGVLIPLVIAASAGAGQATVNVSSADCPSATCTVEVFKADVDLNEGQTLIGTGTGIIGGVPTVIAISGVVSGDIIVATLTTASGNTSEFSDAFGVAP